MQFAFQALASPTVLTLTDRPLEAWHGRFSAASEHQIHLMRLVWSVLAQFVTAAAWNWCDLDRPSLQSKCHPWESYRRPGCSQQGLLGNWQEILVFSLFFFFYTNQKEKHGLVLAVNGVATQKFCLLADGSRTMRRLLSLFCLWRVGFSEWECWEKE